MSGGKVWRLVFTVLMTVMLVILGWFAADAALNLITSDVDVAPNFQESWVRLVYRGTYLIASVFFGIAFGRFIFRKIEEAGTRLGTMSARDKLALAGGLSVGILLSAILSLPIIFTLQQYSLPLAVVLSLLLGVIVTYLCIAAAWSLKEEIHFYIPPPQEQEEAKIPDERFKLLDTNVIIDGRVADVARAGFIEGHLYVPGFVLDELQFIADSADGLKRARGRRGLDILRQMQNELTLTVRTYDKLAPGKEAVDSRLVRLAKAMKGSIVTNDYNLNKVAALEGVTVLNINELALCLKPVVLPGEDMRVEIVKDGKEPGQGVGYLDDGTMVVVEGAKRFMGDTLPVQVQSVVQTKQGKMIFAHIAGADDEDDIDHGDSGGTPRNGGNGSGNGIGYAGNGKEGEAIDRSVRAYTGSRTRRPVR